MGGDDGLGTESAGNYWKSDEKRVMIRGMDFTVEPDTTYRYQRAHRRLQSQLQAGRRGARRRYQVRGAERALERDDRPGHDAPGRDALRDGQSGAAAPRTTCRFVSRSSASIRRTARPFPRTSGRLPVTSSANPERPTCPHRTARARRRSSSISTAVRSCSTST